MLHTTAWVSYEASLCLLELGFTQSVGQFVNWTSGLFLRGLPKIKLGRLYESHILLCLVLFNWHVLAQYAICFIRLIYLTHLLLCVLQIKLFKMSLNWVVEAFPRNWALKKKREKIVLIWFKTPFYIEWKQLSGLFAEQECKRSLNLC